MWEKVKVGKPAYDRRFDYWVNRDGKGGTFYKSAPKPYYRFIFKLGRKIEVVTKKYITLDRI